MYEILFIRIPKNASTTMHDALGKFNVIESRKEEFFDEVLKSDYCQGIYDPTHINLELAVEYLGEGILDIPSFCVCRHPMDRLLSAYKFCLQSNLLSLNGWRGWKFKTFAEYFCKTKDDPNFFQSRSQLFYITYNGVPRIDTIMRFEDLAVDYHIIKEDFNLPLPKLPHLNATKHEDFENYYDDETEQMVRNAYEEDFKYFNYK